MKVYRTNHTIEYVENGRKVIEEPGALVALEEGSDHVKTFQAHGAIRPATEAEEALFEKTRPAKTKSKGKTQTEAPEGSGDGSDAGQGGDPKDESGKSRGNKRDAAI